MKKACSMLVLAICLAIGSPVLAADTSPEKAFSGYCELVKTFSGLPADDLVEPLSGMVSFEDMTKFSVGKAWLDMDAGLRGRIVDGFTVMVVRKFSKAGFDELGRGGCARVVGTAVSGTKAKLQTEFSTGRKVEFRMIDRDGKWKVYDVVAEGVSLVGNFRSQFREILSAKGAEALAERIEGTVSSMEQGQ